MKNTCIKTTAFVLLVSAFASCVSMKKYHASESRINSLQSDSARLQASLRKLSAEKLGIESEKAITEQSLTQQLLIKQQELNAKERQLADREKRLKDLERVIGGQNSSINNLKIAIAKSLVNFKPEELSVEIKDSKLYVSLQEKLLFKTASAKVDPKGVEALGKLAEVLNGHPDIDIMIEGHTDTVPISKKYDDNWDLSVNRAISIARILQYDYHVDPKRLISSGRAEYYPVETNNTVEGRARNRRTEIILYPKLDELYKLINEGNIAK